MRINIWIHKSEIISGKITKWYNCREKAGGNWPDYYQITIGVDEFTKLIDSEVKVPDQFEIPAAEDTATIFERNPDTDEIRSRKFGDYENTRPVDYRSDSWRVNQYNRNRSVEDQISDVDDIDQNNAPFGD